MVPRGIASGECVGVLGNAYVCLLTQDNKAISRIGWVDGSISRIGGAQGVDMYDKPLTHLFLEIDPLPLQFLEIDSRSKPRQTRSQECSKVL